MLLSFSVVGNGSGRVHVDMLRPTALEPASEDRPKLWFRTGNPDDDLIHVIVVRRKTRALDRLTRNDFAVGVRRRHAAR